MVLRDLIQTIGKSLDSLVHFSFVLALFIFIYALLGMQFFAGAMFVDDDHTEVSRANFDTFWWSIVTVFQIIGGENWNDVLYITIHGSGWFLGISFCVSLFILGNYVMLNLFLAILLSNFDDQFEETDDSDSNESQPLLTPEQTLLGKQRSSIAKLMVCGSMALYALIASMDLSLCVMPPIDAHQHRQYDYKLNE